MIRTVLVCLALLGVGAGQRQDAPPAYADMVEAYRSGEVEASVRALTDHDRDWLETASAAFARRADLAAEDLEAAALLHTEARISGWSAVADEEYQLRRAEQLLNGGGRRVPRSFRRDWSLLVARYLLYELKLDELAGRLPAMLRDFAEDGEILVAAGMFYEAEGWNALAPMTPSDHSPRWFEEQAAAVYRRALTSAGAPHEAALRLGRVLTQTGGADEALSVLAPLAGADVERPTRYLAALFMANAHERLGQLERAETAYRAALTLEPGCQTPRLGLSAVLRARGNRPDASTLLVQSASAGAQCDDPWWTYKFGDPRQMDPLLHGLREAVAR